MACIENKYEKNEGQDSKQVFSRGGYQWEGGEHKKGKMSVNMVDVFLYPYMKIEV
jgi:hypothetical protein